MKIHKTLFFFIIFLPLTAEAATLRKRYVNTASTAGGDGTTNGTAGGTRAYASLSAAIVAEADNLVADDVYLEIECSGSSSDTAQVDIDGYTTDATRYIDIYTASSDNHGGAWNTGTYRLIVGGVDNAVVIRVPFVRIRGLQIQNTQNSPSRGITLAGSANNVVIVDRNIIKGPTTPAYDANGIHSYTSNSGVRFKVSNNIIYNFYYGMFLVTGDGDDIGWYLYNNTIADTVDNCIFLSAYGTNDIAKVKNNIFVSCGSTDFVRDGTFDTNYTTSKNITGDTSSPDASYQSKTITFVNQAGDDYHLDPAETDAVGVGDDLSGDGDYAFSNDVDNETRSGSWDIGADETTDGAPTTLPTINSFDGKFQDLTGGMQ